MGIYQRQYQKILAQELLRYLLLGRLPNVDEISKRLAASLGSDGNVTYQYLAQPYKEVFNFRNYNKSLRRIKFDIDVFQEELFELFKSSVERLNYADMFQKVNSFELTKLQALLETLLFTVENADFYFLGAFETFSDTSKTNITESTQGIVDLSEQALTLPNTSLNSSRVYSGHLANKVSWKIDVTEPVNPLAAEPAPGTKFGNMFVDTTSAWVYVLTTDSQVPAEITFRFPLAGDAKSEVEVLISRLEFITHSSDKQLLKVKTSTDDINYTTILGYEEGITLDDQKKVYSLDFETTLVQFVEVTLSKTGPDEEVAENGQKRYKYYFGLKSIAAMTAGRIRKATYVSKPFDFSENTDQITNVSLSASSFKPNGTTINYSVALYDDNSKLSSFIPIAPIDSSASQVGVNQVINFSKSLPYKDRFSVPTTGPDAAVNYSSPFQGKRFYRIGNSLPFEPVFGASKLYRGFKAWYRDSSRAFKVEDVNDNFISFERSDIEALYTTDTETPAYENLIDPSTNERRTLLTLSKPVYYDSSRGHSLIPPPGSQNNSVNAQTNFAVYRVLLSTTQARVTRNFSIGGSNTVVLPSSNFVVQSANANERPIIRTGPGTVFQPNIDYIFEVEDVGGVSKPTGVLNIPSTSAFVDSSGNIPSLALEFEFTVDPDITHKVEKIESNVVTLINSNVRVDENLEIKYRYIPTAPSEIIKASIRLSDAPSTARSRNFYVIGQDYLVDPSTGNIQRIPTGNIPSQGVAYAQYSFRNAEEGIETFQTWCNITASEGIQIRFETDPTIKKNRLVVDNEVGEGFFVNGPQGLVNLTNAVNSPTLGPGWVQFIVRSKNPTANVGFQSNLIDQVIQLRDQSQKKIFRENGTYFREIIALRDPLIQKTLNHLRVNTLLSDRTIFAIDNTTDVTKRYIVINFLPNTTEELYLKGPTDDSDITNVPEDVSEIFLLEWATISQNTKGNKLVIKIDLERSPELDGGITPKVYEYKLRAATN